MKSTKDNILDLLKYIEEQKLDYVLAVWEHQKDEKTDEVDIFTSYKTNEIKKLSEALKFATIIEPKIQKNENSNKI